jgi:hypothetical protein
VNFYSITIFYYNSSGPSETGGLTTNPLTRRRQRQQLHPSAAWLLQAVRNDLPETGRLCGKAVPRQLRQRTFGNAVVTTGPTHRRI